MHDDGRVSLKRELGQPTAAVRRFVDDRLPWGERARAPWGAALRQVPPLLPPAPPEGEEVPSAAIGHALSARITWEFAPLDHPGLAAGAELVGAAGADRALLAELLEVLAGPRPGSVEVAARLAWHAGLLDRAQRTGRADDPTLAPLVSAVDLGSLIAAAPDLWVADVMAVADVAWDPLGSLRGPGARARVAIPAGDRFGGVEAELVARDTLVDLSATTSPKARARDLEVLVITALLDVDDELGITEVAVAPLRFGALVAWDLEGLLCELADDDVTVEEMRADLAARLG